MTPPELMKTLTGTYQMDHDRALRVLEITARLGADSEPVPGGLIELTAVPASDRPGSWDYTLTPHTGRNSAREQEA